MTAKKGALLAAAEEDKGQWLALPAPAQEDDHQQAARNVKTMVLTFLMVDAWCSGTFGFQSVTERTPAPFLKCLALKYLPAVIAFNFLVDVTLAARFLWVFDVNHPRWEDYGKVVNLMWFFSALTWSTMVVQQLAVVALTASMPAAMLAVICLAIRCFKLRPLYVLNEFLKQIAGSHDEPCKHEGYEKLRAYWSHRRGIGSKSKKRACLCTLSLASMVLLSMVWTSHREPTGVPPPPGLVNTSTPANKSTERTGPLMLEAQVCDQSHCLDGEAGYWYLCDPNRCSGVATVEVTYSWNMPEAAGYTFGGAAAFAGFCASIGQEEFVPICAIVGGLGGGGYEVYKVNGDWWCMEKSAIPQTPRDSLWCADWQPPPGAR